MKRHNGFLGFILAIFIATIATPASADWYQAHSGPAMVVCYQKIDPTNYYGGVYQMTNALVNDTSITQYGRSEVYRTGSTAPIFADDMPATPGAWVMGDPVNVSMALNDTYKFKLNGTPVVQIQAQSIPWYLPHCLVRYTGIAKVDSALRFGLSNLDAPYVGGASPYRFGTSGNGKWYQMSGQNSYLSPLGVKGFDCSGLVIAMYRNAGIELGGYPSSTAMKNGFASISASQLRPGDLIVKDGHVAIYIGDGDSNGIPSVLEATPTGGQYGDGRVRGVVISDASKYLNANGTPKSPYVLRRVPGV